MDTAEISARIMKGVDEDPASPTTGLVDEVNHAIDEAQQLFALLTLCLEQTSTINLSSTFGTLRPTFPDFLVPLRLMVDGVRVRPATLSDLDALNTNWQNTAGTPTRYLTGGFNFYGITPQSAVVATMTYARSPQQSLESVFIELPEAHHMSLVNFGIYRVSLKQGAQQLERGLRYLNEFLDDAQALGEVVRARSRASKFDTLPLELRLFDRSRLMLKPPKQKVSRGL